MRNIKFKSPDQTQAQFAATLRRNVDNYFKENAISPKGNWQIRTKALVMLSLYILPFVLILIFPMNAWLALALTVVMGIGGHRDERDARRRSRLLFPQPLGE